MRHASQVIRVLVSGPDEAGDLDPLHTDGPELTRDGSAATSSVTAPTTRAAAWPLSVRTAGLPCMRFCGSIRPARCLFLRRRGRTPRRLTSWRSRNIPDRTGRRPAGLALR